jgi:predicted anti-sigma-YlaC factor YlaD
MTCDQAIERLPWLLNGSLEPAEREEVQGHLTTCAACREALPGAPAGPPRPAPGSAGRAP